MIGFESWCCCIMRNFLKKKESNVYKIYEDNKLLEKKLLKFRVLSRR